MTTVKRRNKTTAKLDLAELSRKFVEHRRAKAAAAAATATANEMRDQITADITKHGTPHGEKGQHLAIDLPEPVDGCTKLVRRANKKTFINVDRAEEMAAEGGYLEEIQVGKVVMVFEGSPAEARKILKLIKMSGLTDEEGIRVGAEQVFSQERLMAYHQRNKDRTDKKALTEKQLDGLYDTDITYSFNPE